MSSAREFAEFIWKASITAEEDKDGWTNWLEKKIHARDLDRDKPLRDLAEKWDREKRGIWSSTDVDYSEGYRAAREESSRELLALLDSRAKDEGQ